MAVPRYALARRVECGHEVERLALANQIVTSPEVCTVVLELKCHEYVVLRQKGD